MVISFGDAIIVLVSWFLSLFIFALGFLGSESGAQEETTPLSMEDEQLLQSLVRDFLFDPRGTERVGVLVTTEFGLLEEKRPGWLVKNKIGDRVYFTDGDSIPAPPQEKITKIDFFGQCRTVYGKTVERGIDRIKFPELASELGEDSNLVMAAWLYRLGNKAGAANIMSRFPGETRDEVTRLRKTLAADAYRKAVKSFRYQGDERALAHVERLLQLYPVEAREFPQAERLRQDLERRKRQWAVVQTGPARLPKNFTSWERKKQLGFLIDSLDLVVGGERGEEPIYEDCHVAALIMFGEAAIPALIETLDRDDRLTRSCPFSLHILTVREIAFPIALSILGVSQIEPSAPINVCYDCFVYGDEVLKKKTRPFT